MRLASSGGRLGSGDLRHAHADHPVWNLGEAPFSAEAPLATGSPFITSKVARLSPLNSGCCRGDTHNRDGLLWQFHGPTFCATEARTAFSGHRQQLRTDLTLRLSERCVEGLSLCGMRGVEHRANQCSVEAGHAPNDSSAGQMTVSIPIATSVRSRHR